MGVPKMKFHPPKREKLPLYFLVATVVLGLIYKLLPETDPFVLEPVDYILTLAYVCGVAFVATAIFNLFKRNKKH